MKNQCKECNKVVQMSLADRFYVEIFGTCWDCDKKHWQDGKLSLEDFEHRESVAQDEAVRHLQACTTKGGTCNGNGSEI